MAQLNFDARTVVPDAGQQDPVPAGWYNVVMDKSEMKPTKDGTGMRLELQFKIIDGQYANRKIFEGLNLRNSNAVAQEIAYKQLSAIAHAVNVLIVEDSSQLHNIPLKVKVNLKAATAQYEAKNEIRAYKNINEVIQQPAAAPAGFGAPAAFGAPPPFAAAPAAFGPPPVAAPAQAWAPPAQAQPWAPPAQAAAPAAPAPAAAPAWAPPPAGPAGPAAGPAAPAWAPAPAAAPLAPPAWAAAPAAPAQAAPEQAAQAPAPAATAPQAGIVPPWATQPAA